MKDTGDDFLNALREFQDSEHKHEYTPWSEWHKAGSSQSIFPGVGMMGHLNTSAFAPTGPRGRPSGERGVGWGGRHPSYTDKYPQFGVPPGTPPPGSRPSRYAFERQEQPTPWVDDVDMSNIWYSPFEPVWPFGPPYYTRPREWNYPVGYNLNFIQNRMETMGMLRGMRQSWGVLATIIETRKDQLLRLPWTIQRKDKPRATSKSVEQIRKFFRRPDGKLTYNQWARKLLDDLFVIDAPSIYMDRGIGGQIIGAEVLDGQYIFPLIDDAGRRPSTEMQMGEDGVVYEHRQPAFQQIVYGLPMINMSEDELIYAMMRPLPEFPVFGYSPVQQILTEASEAIRKTFYQLEFWRSGSIPELIITVPEVWTPRQIATFQAHFDALLSGQLTLKSKVRFVPGGMKPFDIKNADGKSLWSDRDELLVRLACYAFSVSPQPFVKMVNRATAQSAQQTAQEEGLYPLMSWWKEDIMDTIIQEKFGMNDVEFMFLPRPEVDLLKQAQIHQIKLHSGEMTVDEARAENGEEPYADGLGAVPLIYFGSGAVPLEHVLSGEAALPGAPSRDAAPLRPSAQNIAVRGPASRQSGLKQPPTPVHKAGGVTDDDPTRNQIMAGNYRKRALNVHGLSISIENEKGSTRGEKNANGVDTRVKMPAAYGYIRGVKGADGMQVDVYVGKKPKLDVVYVVDQDKFVDGKDHGFDEHKIMLGFKTLDKALKAYLESHFDGLGHERLAAVTLMSIGELKRWLTKADLSRPAAESGFGHVVARRGTNGGIAKADTISSSTGFNWYDQTLAVERKRKKKRKKKLARSAGPRWLQLKP